jgi:hypothetical protein
LGIFFGLIFLLQIEKRGCRVNICGQAAEELQRQQEELKRPEDPAGSGRAWCPILGTCFTQWIGLRENLQETIDFPIKYRAFL